MGLIGTLQDLKHLLYKKNIDVNEFMEKLDKMIEKARFLTMMTHDLQTHNDVIELVAFYTANGDKEVAELVRSLINVYIGLTKGLNEEEYKYFKQLVMFYLQH